MNQTLCLHYAPDNASLCIRLALEELDVPYRTCLVDRSAKAHKAASYLAMNPNGLIPVLETPHGPMFETGAILLWLADTYEGLIPRPGDPARAHALQWLFWLSNTLHPALRMMFYPAQHINGNPAGLNEVTVQRIRAQLDVLQNASYANWLDAAAPTVQGCYLAPMLRWAALYGGGPAWFDLRDWPRLLHFAQRFEVCSAAQRAATAEGLGPTSFSAPSPCTPPEGSAT